jgi:hypothetical protein
LAVVSAAREEHEKQVRGLDEVQSAEQPCDAAIGIRGLSALEVAALFA